MINILLIERNKREMYLNNSTSASLITSFHVSAASKEIIISVNNQIAHKIQSRVNYHTVHNTNYMHNKMTNFNMYIL
jgi:hypothetical protein